MKQYDNSNYILDIYISFIAIIYYASIKFIINLYYIKVIYV